MKNAPKTFAWIFGIVFLLVGIIGYFSNPIVGEEGFFLTNLWHNLVHVITGALFIVFALMGNKMASIFNIVFGIVYLLTGISGFLLINGADQVSLLGLVDINNADNWLHLVLGTVILIAGILTKPSKINKIEA